MEQMGKRAPTGVIKMPEDEDAMFFLDYWQFGEDESLRHTIARRSAPAQYANDSLTPDLLPPFLVHSDIPAQSPLEDRLPLFARDLSKRYTCPQGTFACDDISRPYSCCNIGEVCVQVRNTGLGDVGCCPEGQTCNGMVTDCDTSAGYKSCPGFEGGGCCIPGFDCSGIGCAINTTSTVTTTAPVVTVTSCPGGYSTCPASLGGGCCQSGAGCGSGRSCLTSSTAETPTTTITTRPTVTAANVPARPTGDSDTPEATDPQTTTVGTSVYAVCPTNYYFCSAYYRPGCCRIGRDCSLTNCPSATASETVVSAGATIVVPAGELEGGSTYVTTGLITSVGNAVTTTLRTGACQTGWLSCDQNIGGGCCPPEFGCGTVCSATAAGVTGVVSRIEPASASGLYDGRSVRFWMLCLVSAVLTLLSL